nr:MAG TPA: hypothetical protein [Caudoviricetes sp.]
MISKNGSTRNHERLPFFICRNQTTNKMSA